MGSGSEFRHLMCVHHCSGIITAASLALVWGIISQLIALVLHFCCRILQPLRYIESPAETPFITGNGGI